MMKHYYTRSIVATLCCYALCSILWNSSVSAQIKKTSAPPSATDALAQQQGKLEFQVSVRDAGFMGWTDGGTVAGMMDRGFALDGFQARITGASGGGIWYSVCTDDGVWQPWVTGGETAGAINQRNIHAIALQIYGLPRMNIAYRVHLTGGEWLEWVKNGAAAGVKGKTIDAVEIRLEPGNSSVSTISATEPPPMLTAETVVQNAPVNPASATSAPSSSGSPTISKTASVPSGQAIESFTVQDTPAPAVTKSSALKKTSSASNQTQNAQTMANNNQATNTQQQPNNQSNNNGLQQLGQGIGQGLGQGLGNQGNTAGNNAQNNQQWNNSQPNNQQWNNQPNNQQWNNQPNNQQWNNQPNNTGGQWSNGNNQFSGQNWSQWTNQPMQRAQGFGTAAQPVFMPISSRKVALIANNGRFVSAGNDPRAGAVFTATSTGVRETEIFDLAFVGEHRVALRTINGRYLGLQPVAGGSARLVPQSDVIGQNEVFEMLSAGQDRVAFRAASGHFLSVEEFGAFRLFAKEGFIGQWEYFGIATSDGRPLLSEAQNNLGWQTRQDGNRVIVVDQQGRVVESADRILVLMGNNTPNSTPTTTNNASNSTPNNASSSVPSSASSNTPASTTTAPATKPAPAPATYLTPIEMEILQELNFVRTKPGEYATMLEGYRRFYKGRTFTAPGQRALTTREGVKALDEVILTLKMTRPLEALTASQALSKAARDHVDNAGPRGIVGHVGSDKSNPNDRAARYGKGVVNENCCYNRSTAREIVVRLLIDDGTADRGYRKNILNPAFKLVGTAFGLHKTQQTICSQVFAAEFVEK